REKFARQFLQDLASKPDSVVVLFQDKDGCGVLPKKGLWVDFREKAGGQSLPDRQEEDELLRGREPP
ncbi:MAG: hypothetical protein QXV01_06115, partial [Candidatus Bathyarchaeia archaeon]